jgi:hypothetical protein
MKGKYRIVPLNLGEYDGVKIFDYEEVCVENKDMSFNDYLDIRKLAIIIETIFNNQPFEVFFRYAITTNISRFDFLLRILNNINKAPKKIIDIFNEFKRESKEELWDSEIDLIKYYNRDENYQKLVKGEAGGNLIYKYKSMNLAIAMPEWIEYLTSLLKDLIIEKNKENLQFSPEQIKSKHQEIRILAEYHKNQTWKFLDGVSSEESVTMESKYDFLAWLKGPKSQLLSMYRVKNPIRYFFSYTERQKKERYDQFRRYGTDISALSKIVVRIKPENWLRRVATDSSLIKDNMDTKRSGTRYGMSN